MSLADVWAVLKTEPATVIIFGGLAFLLAFFATAFASERAGDGPFGRAVRRTRDFLGRIALGVLLLFGAALCVASFVFFSLLLARGPERAFGLHDDSKGLLIPLCLLFGSPPLVLVIGVGGELWARERRRRMSRMFEQAAEGTSLRVADVDYPLLELALEARRGVEFLPESLRAAALFKDFSCRVEAVLKGPVAGVDVEIADGWFTTVSGSGRNASSQRHRLTIVAARLPQADPRAERLTRAFAEGWAGLDRVDDRARIFDSRFRGESDRDRAFTGLLSAGDLLDPKNAGIDALFERAAGSPRFGDWLAFGSEAAISDAGELRAVISALAAVLAPPRA
jgi:hypothetical protein